MVQKKLAGRDAGSWELSVSQSGGDALLRKRVSPVAPSALTMAASVRLEVHVTPDFHYCLELRDLGDAFCLLNNLADDPSSARTCDSMRLSGCGRPSYGMLSTMTS